MAATTSHTIRFRVLFALIIVTLVAAACGNDGETGSGSGGDTPEAESTAADATDTGTGEPGDGMETGGSGGDAPAPEDAEPFTVGLLACCTVSDVAMLEAMEIMRAEGYPVEEAELAEPELIVEAVGTDRFQIGQSATTTILLAVQQGAALRAIGERMGNEWLVYSTTEIASCEDLDGARVGIHSEGSSSTAQMRAWINQQCPGVEPSWLIVTGAPNRVQAMLAGELDATPLQVDNGVDLINLSPDEFHELVAFADEFDIRANLYIASQRFVDEQAAVAETWLATLRDIHEQINDDPAYLSGLITKHIPDYNAEIVDQVAQSYSELGLFPPDVGLENMEEELAATIDFLTETGAVEGLDPDLPVEDVLALEPLQGANGQ